MTDEVLYELVGGGIAVLTLNRPRARNAVSVAMAGRIAALAAQVEADPQIRVAVLTSSTSLAFCAGADLAEVAAGRGEEISPPAGGFAGFAAAPHRKPWIAAVTGPALAGGLELVLACDMVVASTAATFGLPEVKRGLAATGGGLWRLPRLLPRNIALELIATGEPIDAARAAALGLVNRVAPADQVLDTALDLARAVAANAPEAVCESLAIARAVGLTPHDEVLEWCRAAGGRILVSDEAQEGAAAFLEKRPPRWALPD